MALSLGSHVSVAGGVDLAIGRAVAFGMDSCQIFTKNASQWAAKPLDPKVIDRWLEGQTTQGVTNFVAHDSYLINIGTQDDVLWEKSRLALQVELDRCDQLNVPHLVSHPGAHVGAGVDAGVARVSDAINHIFADTPDGKSMLLLETTAGQGTTLGRSFEEIAAIMDGVENKARVGVCLDTCHIFVAGYDLRDQESYEKTFNDFDRIIGLGNLKVLHLNDAKKGLGSHVDRHAHIGEGELGLEPFRFLMNDPRFNNLPGILETAKDDDEQGDARNLATLKGLIAE